MNAEQEIARPPKARDPLQRVPLRWLVLVPTAGAAGACLALGAVNHRAAPVALAAAMLFGLKGAFWLLVARRNRARLRRHGFRW